MDTTGGQQVPPIPQRTVGQYHLLAQLGHTPTGPVYLARLPHKESLLALKALPPLGPEEMARLRQDTSLLGRVEHPGVIRPLEVGVDRGRAFVVTEHVPGSTLREQLDRRGPLPARQAARLVADVADALQALHDAGVVHRHLDPSVVVVDGRDGRPKVSELGLARDPRRPPAPGQPPFLPFCLSPEQLRGEPAGPRSDVYALGAVLYELLCGSPPFEGQSWSELSQAVQAGDPEPPGELVAGVPRQIERACLDALALEPDDRPTAAELALRLRRAAGGEEGRGGSPLLVAGLVLALLGAAGAAAWGAWERGGRRARGGAAPGARAGRQAAAGGRGRREQAPRRGRPRQDDHGPAQARGPAAPRPGRRPGRARGRADGPGARRAHRRPGARPRADAPPRPPPLQPPPHRRPPRPPARGAGPRRRRAGARLPRAAHRGGRGAREGADRRAGRPPRGRRLRRDRPPDQRAGLEPRPGARRPAARPRARRQGPAPPGDPRRHHGGPRPAVEQPAAPAAGARRGRRVGRGRPDVQRRLRAAGPPHAAPVPGDPGPAPRAARPRAHRPPGRAEPLGRPGDLAGVGQGPPGVRLPRGGPGRGPRGSPPRRGRGRPQRARPRDGPHGGVPPPLAGRGGRRAALDRGPAHRPRRPGHLRLRALPVAARPRGPAARPPGRAAPAPRAARGRPPPGRGALGPMPLG
ncbi:MAG: serine/threonine protein kinase [Planctomycetes bacterium]|nr:serine/threonine protein kinase [Planctomycetota bacterium]